MSAERMSTDSDVLDFPFVLSCICRPLRPTCICSPLRPTLTLRSGQALTRKTVACTCRLLLHGSSILRVGPVQLALWDMRLGDRQLRVL